MLHLSTHHRHRAQCDHSATCAHAQPQVPRPACHRVRSCGDRRERLRFRNDKLQVSIPLAEDTGHMLRHTGLSTATGGRSRCLQSESLSTRGVSPCACLTADTVKTDESRDLCQRLLITVYSQICTHHPSKTQLQLDHIYRMRRMSGSTRHNSCNMHTTE